jgi:hypothetical protein
VDQILSDVRIGAIVSVRIRHSTKVSFFFYLNYLGGVSEALAKALDGDETTVDAKFQPGSDNFVFYLILAQMKKVPKNASLKIIYVGSGKPDTSKAPWFERKLF